MKPLHDIIDEHFLSSDKEELVYLFNKHGIFDIVSKTSGQLKAQLQRALVANNGAPISAITTTSSNFLISANNQVVKISDPKEKREIQEAIAQIGLRILLSIIKLFPKEAKEIFKSVEQALQMTAEMFGYEYDDINNLLRFDEISDLVQTLSGEKFANEIHEIKQTATSTIIWTKKVHIDYLTTELKKRKWIKKQSEFSKLFSNSDNSLKIHWDMKYKYELAHLLYLLAKGDFIRPKKGVFSVPEKFIVDFSGENLKVNSLKKISSKITNDPTKYTDIIENVEQVIRAITKT